MTMAEVAERFMISKDEKVCFNCKHFVQHYYYREKDNKFHICNAGHCVKPRIKDRKPDHKACEHFEQGNGDGNV